MSAEQFREEEPIPETANGEQFIHDLYDRITQWMQSHNLVKIYQLNDYHMDHWQQIPVNHDEPPFQATLDLEEAAIFTKENLTLAVSIGRGIRDRNFKLITRLQFGGYYDSCDLSEKSEMEKLLDLRLFVSKHSFGHEYLYGEFDYDPEADEVGIDCWADFKFPSKGEDVRNWPQEIITSQKGLDACIAIIERTIARGR